MPQVIHTTVYTFDELTDESAKERARDWYRECIESDELADHDDWETIAGIFGVEFKTQSVKLYGGGTRQEPCIYWSGFSSQGDGASFEGWYKYARQTPKRIRDHAPQDSELHRIADELQAVQKRNGYRLQATITKSHGYSHSGYMNVDTEKGGSYDSVSDDDANAVTQLMRDFADWIYRQLEAQWKYLNSAEAVDESILANGYTFTESGRREG